METTIDGAGRLVIPKRIRDRLGLRPGEALEVEEEQGAIRISRVNRKSAEIDSPVPTTTAEQVREILERTRR